MIRAKTPLITTLINKFDTALRLVKSEDPNLFVLIDESHRSGRHARQIRTTGRQDAASPAGHATSISQAPFAQE